MDTHDELTDIFIKPLVKEPFYKIRREVAILDEGSFFRTHIDDLKRSLYHLPLNNHMVHAIHPSKF